MNSDNNHITRKGILWKSIAGFSQYGCIFSIYQNDFELADNVKQLFDLSSTGVLIDINSQLKKCFDNLLRRNNYINEFK